MLPGTFAPPLPPTKKLMKTIHLFWTGGWDSTFRLGELIVHHKRSVTPHYVIDTGRPSVGLELMAMHRIWMMLVARFDPARELLMPIEFRARWEIPADSLTEMRLKRLKEKRYLGDQYSYLARYAELQGLEGIEIGVLDEHGINFDFLREVVVRSTDGTVDYQALRPHEDYGDIELFRRFRFPLLGETKVTLYERARELGFADILNETWFCYRPVRGRPCGWCTPCLETLQRGLGWRMSPLARFKGRVKQALYSVAGEGSKEGIRVVRKKLHSVAGPRSATVR